MEYISNYDSPLGRMLLAADKEGITGIWFKGAKYYCENLDKFHTEKETEIIKEAKKWLDIYFSGKEPKFMPKINPKGSEFRQMVWEIIRKIPYGETVTYKDIANEISKQKGIKKMSAQAIGGAVGHNKISIIIPCHRVVGTNGNLIGYAGGIEKKLKLLKLEGCNIK